MIEVTLVSKDDYPLRPLIETALSNELRLLEAGIRQTEQRLREFEHKYGYSTEEFIRAYENDEIEETIELAEWIGEHRLLERLRKKANALRGVRFAN